MGFYPVFLDLEGRCCLVVGRGDLARRKAAELRRAGARVLRQGRFRPEEVQDVRLIVAVTEDREEMARLAAFAERRRIWLNVVDQPRFCSFIAPAVVRRGPVQIAISTSGMSPALASRLRVQLEGQVGEELGELARLLGSVRPLVRRSLPGFQERRDFYQGLLEEDRLLQVLRREGKEGALDWLRERLRSGRGA